MSEAKHTALAGKRIFVNAYPLQYQRRTRRKHRRLEISESLPGSPLIESPVWRFTLKHLLLATAAIALGLVALRHASGAWTAALLAIAQFVLAAAILLVVFRRGAARAFWLGFAVFGWLYLLLLIISWLGHSPGTETPLQPYYLATTRLSNACYHWWFDKAFATYTAQYPVPQYPYTPASAWPPPGAPPLPGPNEQDFANVAHALWTLLLALCGGQLAKWLYATQRSPPEQA